MSAPQQLSSDRITCLRTVSNAHLLQLVDDLGPCEPWTRELANRVAEVDRLTRLVQRQADELNRYESLFGPLP